MSLSSSGPAQEASDEPAAMGLRPNHLSLSDVVGQAVGTIAPAGAAALSIGMVFASAGNGTSLAYVFATVTLLLVASSINQFASRSASAGGLYIFAGRGLGPTLGVVAGWSLLFAYLFTAAAVIGGAVSYLLVLVKDVAGIAGGRDLAVGFSTIIVALAWALAYRDIRLSTQASLWIGAITVALIVLVVAGSLAITGPALDPLQLRLTDVTAEQLRFGLVLAFFSFVGFESATVLGSEAQRPLTIIPRAVTFSVAGVGLLFIGSAYALVGTFHGVEPGLDKVTTPFDLLARNTRLGGLRTILSAGIALSLFGCMLGSLNAGARILFTLARHGLVHPALGHAHPLNATPYIALTILAGAALCLSLGFTIFEVGLVAGFGYLGSVATFGFLVAYSLVALAAPLYLRRIGALETRHIVAAAITVVLLAIPLVGSLYPAPAWPPGLLAVLVGLGLARYWSVKLRLPQGLPAMQADFRGDVTQR
ncbi:MAG TPA: APC family permease [Stellaceae bacterium]|nr:APC family permease [Stellaceae bacterium]